MRQKAKGRRKPWQVKLLKQDTSALCRLPSAFMRFQDTSTLLHYTKEFSFRHQLVPNNRDKNAYYQNTNGSNDFVP
jgi:hypothetical protein